MASTGKSSAHFRHRNLISRAQNTTSRGHYSPFVNVNRCIPLPKDKNLRQTRLSGLGIPARSVTYGGILPGHGCLRGGFRSLVSRPLQSRPAGDARMGVGGCVQDDHGELPPRCWIQPTNSPSRLDWRKSTVAFSFLARARTLASISAKVAWPYTSGSRWAEQVQIRAVQEQDLIPQGKANDFCRLCLMDFQAPGGG